MVISRDKRRIDGCCCRCVSVRMTAAAVPSFGAASSSSSRSRSLHLANGNTFFLENFCDEDAF